MQRYFKNMKKNVNNATDKGLISKIYKNLERTLESPLDSKEIKPVNPKENQPRIFIGRIDAEAEAPVLWPPDMKSQLTGKGPEAGKD